jgi:Threonine synthase
MQFTDERNQAYGILEASVRGYPERDEQADASRFGVFSPTSDADIRPAIYAPESSFAEVASSVIAALFPEDVDPFMAERLAARAFPLAPAGYPCGDDIILADFTAGPSRSSVDPEAALLAGILAQVARRKGPLLLVANGTGPDGAALAEAIAGLRDLSLALLYPAGREALGVRDQLLSRAGGQTKLVAVRGDRDDVRNLIRNATGAKIGGMSAVPSGPANPGRIAARIVNLAASFAFLRKGAAGDFFIGVRGQRGFDLTACLWAWKVGLPMTGIVLPRDAATILGSDPAGKRLIERFEDEYQLVTRSLVLMHPVDRESAVAARDRLVASGGPEIDLSSAMTLAAAELALDAGLRDHARIIVPWGAAPYWDEGARPDSPPAIDADAEIAPDLEALSRALTA